MHNKSMGTLPKARPINDCSYKLKGIMLSGLSIIFEPNIEVIIKIIKIVKPKCR